MANFHLLNPLQIKRNPIKKLSVMNKLKYLLFIVALLVFFRTCSTLYIDGLTLFGIVCAIFCARIQYKQDYPTE